MKDLRDQKALHRSKCLLLEGWWWGRSRPRKDTTTATKWGAPKPRITLPRQGVLRARFSVQGVQGYLTKNIAPSPLGPP